MENHNMDESSIYDLPHEARELIQQYKNLWNSWCSSSERHACFKEMERLGLNIHDVIRTVKKRVGTHTLH